MYVSETAWQRVLSGQLETVEDLLDRPVVVLASLLATLVMALESNQSRCCGK